LRPGGDYPNGKSPGKIENEFQLELGASPPAAVVHPTPSLGHFPIVYACDVLLFFVGIPTERLIFLAMSYLAR
jgi:hypothetical protein